MGPRTSARPTGIASLLGQIYVILVLSTLADGVAADQPSYNSSTPWIQIISWKPRAFVYHNFLSEGECDHIVKLARPQMRRSTVVGDGGKSVADSIRTSYGTFIKRATDPVITQVEQRLANWTMLGVDRQEDLQILRYGVGQKYGSHYDSLIEDTPRLATVLMYLSNVTLEGGETAFPEHSEWVDPALREYFGPFSPCAKDHVAMKPKKGDALLFYSLGPDGTTQDPTSMHTGCPIIKGTKWTATKWVHSGPFHPEWLNITAPVEDKEHAKVLNDSPEDCVDTHQLCASWAKDGECTKNPLYMSGDSFNLGRCRASCGACEPCASEDLECRKRNRLNAGFLALDEVDE